MIEQMSLTKNNVAFYIYICHKEFISAPVRPF